MPWDNKSRQMGQSGGLPPSPALARTQLCAHPFITAQKDRLQPPASGHHWGFVVPGADGGLLAAPVPTTPTEEDEGAQDGVSPLPSRSAKSPSIEDVSCPHSRLCSPAGQPLFWTMAWISLEESHTLEAREEVTLCLSCTVGPQPPKP